MSDQLPADSVTSKGMNGASMPSCTLFVYSSPVMPFGTSLPYSHPFILFPSYLDDSTFNLDFLL